MASLRKYGSLNEDVVDNSVSRKQFNEVVFMRDEYKVLFEDLLKKFNDQMNEEYRLKKIAKDKQFEINELFKSNAAKDNVIEKLKQELAAKNEENLKLVEIHELEIFEMHEINIEKDLKIEELKAAINSKCQENSRLMKKNLQYQEILERTELEIFELNEINIENDCEICQLKNRIAQMANEKSDIEEEISNLEKECQKLVYSFDCASQEIAIYLQTIKKLEYANKEFQNKINDHSAVIKSFETINRSKDEEIKLKKLENEKLWDVVNLLQESDKDQLDKISKLNEENIILNSELEELEKIMKEVDGENFRMVDSFDDIFRLIREAKQALPSRNFFGRLFNKNTPTILKYLRKIEVITNLYE